VTQTRTYPHGVPCWIDTEQPDAEAARHFYGELFGWSFEDAVPADAPRSYWIATLDGRDVAAIAPAGGDEVAWNTYIAVDDADASAALAASQGGTIASEPADAGPGGRTAACVDPTGAAFRLWQARGGTGAQLVNAPGSWNFSDLHTDDPERASAFYPAVFGWEADALDLGGGATATMWRRPGYGDHLEATVDPEIRTRQAGVQAPPGFEDCVAWLVPLDPSASPPHWHVTFAFADRDESVAAAERLGASVVSSDDSDWTRSALIRDPQGAELTLSQFTPPGG
jgi:uncharacterized protein